MIGVKETFIPAEHAYRVVLTDSHGKVEEMKIPAVVTREISPGEVVYEDVDIDAEIEQVKARMLAQAQAVAAHRLKRTSK